MSINEHPKRSPTVECVDHHVVFVGGSAAVTKVADTGIGLTVTYVSTGIVDLKWLENPGLFLGLQTNFQATTVAAVKGYTCVYGVPTLNADGSQTLRLNITGDGGAAAPALVDLAVLQWLYCTATFKRSGSGV